jgi:hypothetical protein
LIVSLVEIADEPEALHPGLALALDDGSGRRNASMLRKRDR